MECPTGSRRCLLAEPVPVNNGCDNAQHKRQNPGLERVLVTLTFVPAPRGRRLFWHLFPLRFHQLANFVLDHHVSAVKIRQLLVIRYNKRLSDLPGVCAVSHIFKGFGRLPAGLLDEHLFATWVLK